MRPRNLTMVTMFGLWTVSMSANAGLDRQLELAEHIDGLRTAIENSSVSPRLSADTKGDSLSLLARAGEELGRGNGERAAALTRLAARSVYPMDAHPPQTQRERLDSMQETLRSLVPQALRIAALEGTDLAPLATIARDQHAGEMALEAGRLAEAEALLGRAYLAVQRMIAGLRNGDVLVLPLRIASQ